MVNKILLATTLLTRLLSAPNLSLAQDTIRLTISHKNDSTFCSSLLGHQQFLLEFYVPEQFEDNVRYSRHYFDIEMRIQTGPWLQTEWKMVPAEGESTFFTDQRIKTGAYLDYFLMSDSLYYSVYNGKALVEVRLRAFLKYKNSERYHFSNIDTLLIDIPTPEDHAAFRYFASLRDTLDLNEFIWMQNAPVELIDQYGILCDSFPGTILSDMACFQIWRFRYDREMQTKNELTQAECTYLLDTYQQLLNSKSTYIRMLAKEYYGYGMYKKLE
jgi:hypothetical protein